MAFSDMSTIAKSPWNHKTSEIILTPPKRASYQTNLLLFAKKVNSLLVFMVSNPIDLAPPKQEQWPLETYDVEEYFLEGFLEVESSL